MNIEEALDFQIGIEERAGRIYEKIGSRFSSAPDAGGEWIFLWRQLAEDEMFHAALLRVEKEFLQNGARVRRPIEIDASTREGLEALLRKCEEKIGPGLTREEALRILASIEQSEVNYIFSSLLSATDSKVLTRFTSFSSAHREHEARVLEGIKRMEAQDAQPPSSETA